jgi:hypothetical protein
VDVSRLHGEFEKQQTSNDWNSLHLSRREREREKGNEKTKLYFRNVWTFFRKKNTRIEMCWSSL